ncbi:erythromycin esterase family protein [Hymenobacter actinosclerus]|uniref:Erythromycin esterase homolog n=1 Tax=Hymenobacter actinosclerus TaxID=82805 RepID=A0A1H9ZNR1_9BACT|nr:erythromycin esterase family protein [Hymenobacter actinosclerus]SES83199.1 Erythromycin esterase homolog [Hymenobacter actinosclerus]
MKRLFPAAFGLLLTALSGANALAQTTPSAAAVAPLPLPVHAIRTIDPADADFTDLEFLRQEIGGARVVMLGEPTHGEGNVTEAKIRLIRFLKERLGFTTVAFESGFYELNRAQQELEKGASAAEALDNSVFPVWTGTQEFQQLLPLLGPGGLKVAGFDGQLSGAYQEELLEELQDFLKPEKGADGIAYDYLEECVSMMGEHFIFPPANSLTIFNLQIGKARKLLEKVAAGPDAKRRARAAFWLQNLRSLQAMARDYATNDPAAKDSAEFKASDNNSRDAQMADNLLWYLRQHPQEKVVCWAALPHVANQVEALADAEIQTFRPMGRAVKSALGEDAVYVLGTLSGGGEYGFGPWGQHRPVPVPAAGSLEAALLAQGQPYSFISLKHTAAGKQLTTYAFEYKPFAGLWSQVVDGFLFLRSVNPPHPRVTLASAVEKDAAPADTLATARFGGRINPAMKPVVGKTSGAALMLSGVILDRKTGQPVPFATVAVPARSAGTVSDAQGRFRLEARRGELVQVSSIGYEPATLAAAAGAAATVRLVPAAFALSNVRVSAQSQDPKRIMKKVIKAAAANYEQQDYTQQLYAHRRVTGFDTLRHEVEYTAQEWTPAGYHHWAGGFLFLEKQPMIRVQEKQVATGTDNPDAYREAGYGFAGGFDPVRVLPLFKTKTMGKFRLQLDSIEQRGNETYYVISFAAKRASPRAVGYHFISGYSGKLYIRQQDYAVVRYESLMQHDTMQVNAIARKYSGRNNSFSRIFPAVFNDHRATQIVTYQQGDNGRYYAATSIARTLKVGHVLGRQPFYIQQTCDAAYSPPTVISAAEVPDRKAQPELHGGGIGIYQLPKVPYHPEFWQTYQRPMPAELAPALEVTK